MIIEIRDNGENALVQVYVRDDEERARLNKCLSENFDEELEVILSDNNFEYTPIMSCDEVFYW